jgi:sulfite exporter TauE/SafE
MTALLTAVFLASLIGSLHCAGMCGPFVAFATLHRKGETTRPQGSVLLQLAYHGGRLAAYVTLGAIAGQLGAALNLGAGWLGFGRAAAFVAGILLIAFGLSRILVLVGVRLPAIPGFGFAHRAIAVGQAAATRLTPVRRALAVGVLTAVLPCGWLYAFVAVAAGTGQAIFGAAVLFVFWGGTVPILAGLGAGLGTLLVRAGRGFQIATAVLVMLLGLQSLAGRSRITAARVASPTTSLDSALHRVSALLGHKGAHRCH